MFENSQVDIRGQLNFEGSKSCCGIASSSARQTVTADITTFAETVSGHTQLKTKTIPILDVALKIFGPDCRSVFREDNTAFIQACRQGRSPSLRHLPKMDGVDLQLLHDVFGPEGEAYNIDLVYTNSADICALTSTRRVLRRWRNGHTQEILSTLSQRTKLSIAIEFVAFVWVLRGSTQCDKNN